MALRVVLDVNVWVNHYLALSKGRQGSNAQLLVGGAFAGYCRLGPVQPVISHAMLDTLQEVLIRIGLPENSANMARDAVEGAAIEGVLGQAPYAVLGGQVQPLLDTEDGGVLDVAVAAEADLLVTNNLRDFMPGPRSDIDADVIRRDLSGQADILLMRHPRTPSGLVITNVFAAKAWLVDGVLPPSGLLQRFMPAGLPGNETGSTPSQRG